MGSSSSKQRTDQVDFILDLLDFLEEKILEAREDSASQAAAVTEAARTIPIIWDRVRKVGDLLKTKFMLVFEGPFSEASWPNAWDELADMTHEKFVQSTDQLVGPDGKLNFIRMLVKQHEEVDAGSSNR